MRWSTLAAALALGALGCTEGLGQDGQRLATAMDDALSAGIEADGVMATRLFSGADIYSPWISTFSRDGRYQAFTHWSSGDGDLAIRDLTTGSIRHLTGEDSPNPGRGFAMGNRFSSDDEQIAFGWWGEDGYVLNVVGVDGSGLRTAFDPKDRGADEVVVYDWTADDTEVLAGLVTWEEPTDSGYQGMGFELVAVSLADGSVEVLLPFNAEGRIPANRAFYSPDGRFVAYSTNDLFVLDRSSGRRSTLLGGPSEEQVLGWSNDGEHLFALSDRGGSPSVWALPMANGESRGDPVLVRGDVYGFMAGHVAGDRLVYHVVSEAPELLVVDIDPSGRGSLSEPSRVINGGSFWDGELAAWSPNGESLAYVQGNPARLVIRAARNDNHVQVFDLPSPYAGVYSVRWAPDSRSLVISARSLGTQGTSRMLNLRLESGEFEEGPINPAEGRPVTHDLRTVYKVDTGGVERISLAGSGQDYVWTAPGLGVVTGPEGCGWGRGGIALSPSDDRIAVTANPGLQDPSARNCIGVVALADGTMNWVHRGAPGELLYGLEWSADGAFLHFLVRKPDSADEVWAIPAAGGEPRKLFEYENIVGGQAPGFAVHPDGDKLVFRAGEENHELWVMEGLEEVLVRR
jgi:Tol biopolymer transport system component